MSAKGTNGKQQAPARDLLNLMHKKQPPTSSHPAAASNLDFPHLGESTQQKHSMKVPNVKFDRKGAQPISIAVNHERKAALASSSNHIYESKAPKASHVYDAFVETILRKGGYLNSVDILNGLQDKIPDLDKMQSFKDLQNMNKQVHCAVACYWNARSVRTYFELQEFVIDKLAGYKQMKTKPKAFSEFGLGSLAKNEVVLKCFELYDLRSEVDLPNISTQGIVQCMLDFLRANPAVYRVDSEGTAEDKFNAHLRKFLHTKLTGVNVDFKSLFYSTQQSRRDWFKELTDCRTKYGKEYKEELCVALDSLVAAQSKRTVVPASLDQQKEVKEGHVSRLDETFLRSVEVNSQQMLAQFQAIATALPALDMNANNFNDLTSAIILHRGINRKAGLSLGISAMETPSGAWLNLTDPVSVQEFVRTGGTNARKVMLASSLPAKTKELLVSAVLGFVSYLISSRSAAGADEFHNTEDADWVNRDWFRAHLLEDVPEVFLTHVRALLKKIINPQEFIRIVAAGGGRGDRATLDWMQVKQEIESLLDGTVCNVVGLSHSNAAPGKKPSLKEIRAKVSHRKSAEAPVPPALSVPSPPDAPALTVSTGSRAFLAADYLAVLTIAVVYNRVLVAEQPSKLHHPHLSGVKGDAGPTAGQIVCDFVARSVNETLVDSVKLAQLLALSEESGGPTAAIVSLFLSIERTLLTEYSVPSFECARLGGSFLYFLASQLSTIDAAKSDANSSADALREAVQRLHKVLSPAIADENGGPDADLFAESTDIGQGALTNEALLAAVSMHLSAVLSSREFAQDSGTDGGISSAATLSVASQVTQLLSEVEQRVQETEGFWTSASLNSSASFLNIATALLESDPEVAQRVQHLLALPQVPNVVKTQVGSEEEEQGSLQLQRSVSVELAMQAVLLNVSSGYCLSIFDSLQQCKDSIAQVLVVAFHVPLDTGLRQADRVFQQLKVQGAIHFDESRGSVEVRTNQTSSVSSVLTFASAADATIRGGGQDDKMDTPSSAWTENMIELLLQTPLGTSCAEFTLWAEQQQSSVDTPSIAEFILQHQAVLQSRRSAAEGVTFFVVPGTDDCVPLPQGIPSVEVSDRLMQALQTKQYSLAASYCMAASMTLIDETAVSSAVNAFFLQSYESLGADAMDRLSDLSLQLAYALPRKCRAGQCAVLRLCLKALAAAGKINNDTAQHCVWQAALRSGAAGLRLLRLLLSVGMAASVEFPVFAECAKEWSTNGVNIISRATAESQRRDKEASAAEESAPSKFALPEEPSQVVDVVTNGTDKDENDSSKQERETALAVPVSEQKALILNLLEQKYHYTQGGLVRPAAESPEGRQLQQAMMLLSATLYSSQVHFVMELIQNADDNTYLPGVTPTIRLELFPHAVVVYNNEQGFSDKNIKAICDVGGSTKANKTGYIGQKGIGFKSVFSISDVPEVHSNGYHIAFRREVSMLEPQWLDPTSESQWPSQYDSSGTYYETCLRLKLDAAALKNLAKLNQDIQAVFNGKLILFLNKLERMVLEDRMRNQVVEHCRTRLSDNWMRISIEANTSASTSSSPLSASTLSEVFWLVLRHKFSPTVRRMEVVVAETEVAIAFKFIKTGRRFKSTKRQQQVQSAAEMALVEALEAEADQYNENQTSKHRNGKQGGGTQLDFPVDEDEQIRLDFSEGLMPVYAYLPTSTCCFRFMVQGDFVLPTNRESILEQNEWNLGLLNQVPRVFVKAITEMSRWCEAESQALIRDKPSNDVAPSITDFPVLSQLVGSAYRLLIEPADLLRALPRRREATRDYIEGVVSNIYKELRAVPCLQSRSGAMCAPSQLVAVHHLDFDPATFVSEELLLAATGCQYAMHDTGVYELDNDLVADLGVRIFDTSCIVECLQHLSSRIKDTRSTVHDATIIKQIASAVLGLDTLLRVNFQQKQTKDKAKNSSEGSHTLSKSTSALTSTQRSLKPSQLFTRALPVSTTVSTLTYTLEPAVRDLLRQLCIWPTSTGTFATLEHTLLLVQKKRGGAAFTSQQQECLNEFKDRLHMIDASLLDAAAACTTQGADLLINFLVDNFKQVRLSGSGGGAGFGTHSKTGLGTELGAQLSGGVEELTADIVLKRVILPAYKNFAEKQSTAVSTSADDAHPAFEAQETKGTERELDRRTAAAFLAFLFHSKWAIKLNTANSEYAVFVRDVGVVVPVLTAREGNRGLAWTNKTNPSLILVKKMDWDQLLSEESIPQTEVHLGLEIAECASSALAALHTTTALRQLSWQVLDPLAACFMLGSSKVSLDQQKEAYTAAEVNAAFRAAQNLEDMKQWKEFLLRVGLVNFFGVYKTDPSQFKAPSLYRLLDHLLRNSVAVNTSKQGALTDDFLPLFLPSSARDNNNVNPGVLRVTQDVHNSLLKIAELITLEVLQVRQTKAASSVEQGSAFLADLDRRCWLPIEVHEKLRDGSFGSAHGHFVCAPRYVISTHAEKSSSVVWYFGAHCAYLPHKLASNPAFRLLFHFHEISSKDSPSAEFLIGYLTWLCEQTEVSVFSSVRFMRWFYEEVKTSLLNSENAHASSIVQQRLAALLQDDAALVWIPDQVQLTSQTSTAGAGVVDPYQNESFSACYAGKMFPLSRLVKRDPSEHLHFDASPVKSLALFYGGTAVMDLFARTQYCKACQAVEGMFGVRGGGSDYNVSFPQLRCTCVHSKDSRLSSLLSLEKGVVRNSPGAVDLADTLLFYCKELVGADVEEEIEGGVVTLAPKRMRLAQIQALEGEKSEARAQADCLLNALSMNVWKCFQIQHSLHPYSSTQLHELKNYFLKHALLPTTLGQKYVCALPDKASHVQQVALDDLEAFKLFEPELAALQGSVEWLQVFSADSPEVDNVFEEDGGSSAYDMDALKESEQLLLQLPASEFRTAVGTIPKQTFLAPSNKLALYEFLGIKKFSDHIQESWIKEPSAKQTKTGPAATLVGILNNLLTYAQAHYHHREQKKQQTPQLSQFDALQVYNMVTQLGSVGTRVHSLMQMEVVECCVLQRRVTLALGEVRAENVLDATHHREFTTSPAGTRTNTLYVSAQLSAAEVQNLAVSLLTKALRVEVALLEQRHDVEDRIFLRQKFDFVAKVTNEQFQTILGSDNLSVLPSELTPWCMRDVNVTEEVDLEEDSAENNAAVEAYQNLRKAKKEKQNQQAGKVAPKTEKDLKFEAYRKEQAEKMKAEGEASAAVVGLTQQVAEVVIGSSLAGVEAVLLELSAKETLKVINDDLAPMGRVKNTSAVLGVYDGPNAAPVPALSISSTPDNIVPLDPPLPPLQPGDAASANGSTSMEHHLPQPPSEYRGGAVNSYSNSMSSLTSLCGTYSFLGQAPKPHENFPQGAPTDRQQPPQHVNLTHVYQPRQLQPPPSGMVDVIYCDQLDEDERSVVTIPEEPISVLQEGCDNGEIMSDGSGEGNVQQFANRRQNFVSGRIGEALAVRHLRRRLLQQRNDTPVPCTAVRWLNEHTESGLPYDIELTFADGSVKHCEVKTQQSSVQQLQAPSQWLVSPAEVAQAHLERHGYFCVFVSLRIDYATHQVEDLQTRIVGYEQGLTAAIYCDQATLYIQTNC